MSLMNQPAQRVHGWPLTFTMLWLGQSVSLIGSVLTGFALGVYVFRSTGSVTQFAILNLFVFLPQVVVPPLAGALADRYSRKWLMVLANLGGGLTTLLLAALVVAGHMNVPFAYLATLLFATFAATLSPAQFASVPLLVPEEHLGRANGLVELAMSVSRFVSPPLGGVLISLLGLGGILLIDFATFILAILALLPLFIPQPETDSPAESPKQILVEATDGLRHILPRPGLLGVLIFMAAFNVAAGFTISLATPMVLSTESPQALGLVSGAGGLGLLAGSALMTVWGGPRRKIHGVLGIGLVFGLIMALPALKGAVPVYAAWVFLVTLLATVGNVSSMVIWQTVVPPGLQGRVIGSMTTITFSAMLASFVLAGPLVDRLFEPALLAGGPLAGSLGRLVGVGPGRGIALLLLVAGGFPLVAALLGYLSAAVRGVEDSRWDAAAAPLAADAAPA